MSSAVQAVRALATFTHRQWVVAVAAATFIALATGLPTDLVPNPWFGRMTPILAWNYPVWAATAILSGLVAATYVRRDDVDRAGAAAAGGGFLSFFAVGCPICNKLVVWLIGVGGALSLFAPIQPYLAAVGLGALAFSLVMRLRAMGTCATGDARGRAPDPATVESPT